MTTTNLRPKLKIIPLAKHSKPSQPPNEGVPTIPNNSVTRWPPPTERKGSCYFWEIEESQSLPNTDIYAFDLDGTLIKTKEGNRFAKDGDDWQPWDPIVPSKLRQLLEKGACILIITNQKGLSSGKTLLSDLEKKVTKLIEQICVPITSWYSRFGLYIASDDDRYRKPYTGIWDLIPLSLRSRVRYYCGDACGRKGTSGPGDHSSTDRYFATNVGIPFHTPEEIFLGQPPPAPHLIEVYPAKKFIEMPEYSTTAYEKNLQDLLTRLRTQEKTVCIMVGAPGSGKSSLALTLTQLLNTGAEVAIHVERDALGGVQKRFLNKIASALTNKNMKWIMADATHPNHDSRSELITLVERTDWKVLFVHVEAPIELAQHMDACRVQLKISEKPMAIVVFRTFYKRFREDTAIKDMGRWITFTGVPPTLAERPEYSWFQY